MQHYYGIMISPLCRYQILGDLQCITNQDPALCGDMSDPYADGNESKILPMFDPYADGKRQILPDVRSKQGMEMAGQQQCPIPNSYICP